MTIDRISGDFLKDIESKIPKKAKRVFHGVLFDIYQWQQRLYDGSYATFERAKRIDSVFVIPVFENKILVAKITEPGMRSTFLFGGMGEKGERPIDTAKRELLEESGLVSDDFELLYKYGVGAKVQQGIHLYAARNCKRIREPHLDPGEKIEMIRLDFNDFIKLGKGFWGEMGRYFHVVEEDKKKLKQLRKKLS